jgi:hypothetical protein
MVWSTFPVKLGERHAADNADTDSTPLKLVASDLQRFLSEVE